MINIDMETGLFRDQTVNHTISLEHGYKCVKGKEANSHTHLLDQGGLENASQICLLELN